jgi:hypothetical protein
MGRILVAVGLWVAIIAWPFFVLANGTKQADNEKCVDPPVGKWALTVYAGVGTDGGIGDISGLHPEFNDAYMLDVACSRELIRWWQDRVALEVEGQVAQHFNKQDHFECNLLLALRWLRFPWNHVVRTSFAVGEGVSYASSVPEISRERSPDKTSKWLNYMMYELELAPPQQKHWSFVARIHHRSGVRGLYNGVKRGSNIIGAGVKYRF